MQTSPVLNTLAPAQPQANKSADASASTDSFNQALTREIAGRNNASETPHTQEADAQNSTKPVARNGKQETKASDADKSTDDSDTSASDASDATTVINDMLALVSTFNQINAATATATTAATTAAVATAAAATTPAATATATTTTTARPASTDSAIIGSASDAAPYKGKPGMDVAVLTHARSAVELATRATPHTSPHGEASTARAGADAKAGTPATDFARTLDAASNASEPDTATKTTDLSGAALKPGQDFAAKVKDPIASAEAKPELAIESKEIPAAATAAALLQTPRPVVDNLAPLAAAHTRDHLAPQVGTPAWEQAVGQKVTWMIAGEQQTASLTLNPPDLGPLQVVLNVTNSHADASFIAAQPEVRQALEAAMPRLRDMLSDAGIQLGQATVSSGSPGQQGAPDQQPQQGRRTDFSTIGFDTPRQVTQGHTTSSGLGLVDTFV